MNKKNLILGITAIIVLSVFIIFISSSSLNQNNQPFNQVELSDNNNIVNNLELKYYDTIIKVGLDAAGLKGITLNVLQISEAAKNGFDGELKAHIRLYDGQYYLFIDKFNRLDAIEVIAHEIVHIDQYNSSNLVYDSGTIVYWLGKKYDVLSLDYDARPWEKDAFDKQEIIEQSITRVLYSE